MISLFGARRGREARIFDRLKQAVASTKAQLAERIEEIVERKATLDESVINDLEATLITADLGMKTTQEILGRLKQQIRQHTLTETAQLRPAVEQVILTILEVRAPGRASPPSPLSRRRACPRWSSW